MKKLPPIKFKWHHLEMSTGGTKDVNKKKNYHKCLFISGGFSWILAFSPLTDQ